MSEQDFARLGNYALMLQKSPAIDRRKCMRTVPMEVLSLGPSRTGTLSMQRAFVILGYADPYHFSSIFGNVKDCDMWKEAFHAKYHGRGSFGKEQWDQLLGHCSAVTDFPCAYFGPELMDAYPEARAVLVERHVDKWVKSFGTLINEAYHPVSTILGILDPTWMGRINGVGYAMITAMTGQSTERQIMRHARTSYEKHYQCVREEVRARSVPLLEYRLGEGWLPLCQFLGKDIPQDANSVEIPFPHMNEKDNIQAVFSVMARKSLGNVLRNVFVAACVLFLVAWISSQLVF
ncbi:hypothetical protein EDD37DRAFT_135814 [Exophiala viscosa]|uniref:Efflux pump antibiotic resistance protein n=1 Tax=Exophiala viscosa TaxID=2486360 RepID=A0AAN6I9B9_9EURO|nr:hypothetical protein EDD36DRAFT_482213 [Exophiala viscosa]KAI1620850.1 hypothetical protein EDD37DRAFT_135814 [Exophiala viscosa]